MTETSESHASTALPSATREFVLSWGEMGERWGMNRSVAQVHALLYAAERPLSAEDIAAALEMARSNVSTSLRELLAWRLIERAPALGERRDYFRAETDLWTMLQRIAAGRKARELDPAAGALQRCVALADADPSLTPEVRRRLASMLDFVQRFSAWHDDILALDRVQLGTLLRLGAGVARLLPRKAAPRARPAS